MDTSVLIKWFDQENGFEKYQKYFIEKDRYELHLSTVTLFEIAFAGKKIKKSEKELTDTFAYLENACQINEIRKHDLLRAIEIKFKYFELDKQQKYKSNLSMADAVIIATAESIGAKLLSGDKGFKQVSEVAVID